MKIGKMPFKWFIGVVKDLDDPTKTGRVRVQIIDEDDSEDISVEELRWAYQIIPLGGASLGVGISPTGLLVGAHVIGFFVDPERNMPIVWGTWHKIPEQDEKKHDVSKLARGVDSGGKNAIVKEQGGRDECKEPASAYEAKYPYNKTLTTSSGHAIEIDDTPNSERLHIYHKSGTYTEVNVDGQMVRKVVGDDYSIVIKDQKLFVGGKINIIVEGDADIEIGGDATVAVEGDMDVTVGGDYTLDCSGDVTITGSRIDLNP